MTTTLDQFPAFLGTLYAGIIIGLEYDLFRIMRLPFRSMFVIAFFDFAFYALAGISYAFMLLRLYDGAFRLYTLFGAAIGVFCEQFFFSAFIRRGLRAAKSRLKSIFKK